MTTHRPRPESERPMHGPIQDFDLDAETQRLRKEDAYTDGRRNAITLRKGEGMNVVLLAMKAGDRLHEHSASGPMTLSVREGWVRFEAAGHEVEAGPRTLISCDAGTPHTVEALEESVCLLTISALNGVQITKGANR